VSSSKLSYMVTIMLQGWPSWHRVMIKKSSRSIKAGQAVVQSRSMAVEMYLSSSVVI
jgi:hypothetical protein